MKFFVVLSLVVSLAFAAPAVDQEDPVHNPGGLHKIALNDPKLLEVLAHVQPDLNARLNSLYYHKIGAILSAERQVVAGVKYHVRFEFEETDCLKNVQTFVACTKVTRVEICEAQILSQPWLQHLHAESFHCAPKAVVEKPVTGEFYAEQPAGGLHKIDVNDAHLVESLTGVQSQINDKVKSDQFYRVGKILEAESQVVSGVMYHIKFELGETQCLKSKVTKETNILKDCDQFNHVQICNGKIWSQPWLHHLELSDIRCEPQKAEVHQVPAIPAAAEEYFEAIAGGLHKIDLNDATLLETLTAVQPQINDRLNSMYFHRISHLLEAQSQVVSGVMYHVKFELAQTQCLKSKVTKDTNLLTECSELSHIQTCTGKIWSQPWLHHLELSEIHCEARRPEVHLPGDIRGPTIPL